ncbi:CPBP family intramembrane metalloprotease [Methanosarcina sp. KYL-1]|uniref:CPBP family intramembrane glutamic endopeptidase n=1 Tax=Methanosarcina sp. KYL-1 TaxID=2602068 RepID=UPI0021012F99|nr:CPBP family intramembrane glutamic endopeptidase [Methanosarcina sp. KYL-1]MCQ1535085.1 CPBP family intramembrane metalloprotease [Methanosarcina sp. KYL-1]
MKEDFPPLRALRELRKPGKAGNPGNPGKNPDLPEKKEAREGGWKKDTPEFRRLALLTGIPVLSIALAELLIYSGKMGAAVWLHIATLIALSLSSMSIKTRGVNQIYQALMLLPILRLVNLSMPVFFETTLYTFIFIYGPLAVPAAIVAMSQQPTLKQMGVTSEKLGLYLLLSVPLGFLLGLGEYATIRTGYLIPDLSLENVLKLTFIMIFFVGLIEEVIFRSILQTRLEEVLGMREGMIIASLLFGLMHSGYGTFYEILYTGFVGLFMGFAFQKTRSLPFVVTLHGFVNVFLFGIIPHLSMAAGHL